MTDPTTLDGKICLITGATSGIGRATAARLAARGARVFGVGRDWRRCAAAQEEIPGSEFFCADLASTAELRRLCEDVLTRTPRLHLLINNAGAMYPERRETVDGFERTFALNYLTPFQLTLGLLEALREGASDAGEPSRVINVASSGHEGVELDFEDLQNRRYSRTGWPEYQRAKLALILFTREAARRVDPAETTIHAMHPGVIATDFPRKAGLGLLRRLLVRLRSAPVAQGVDALMFCATSPRLSQSSGLYWVDEKDMNPSDAACDENAARRLWQASETLVADAVSSAGS